MNLLDKYPEFDRMPFERVSEIMRERGFDWYQSKSKLVDFLESDPETSASLVLRYDYIERANVEYGKSAPRIVSQKSIADHFAAHATYAYNVGHGALIARWVIQIWGTIFYLPDRDILQILKQSLTGNEARP